MPAVSRVEGLGCRYGKWKPAGAVTIAVKRGRAERPWRSAPTVPARPPPLKAISGAQLGPPPWATSPSSWARTSRRRVRGGSGSLGSPIARRATRVPVHDGGREPGEGRDLRTDVPASPPTSTASTPASPSSPAASPGGRHALGRRAADAGDLARATSGPKLGAVRRALAGVGANPGRAHPRDHQGHPRAAASRW